MGDLVVTTPIYRALRRQLNAEVHLVTKPAFAPIVANSPYLHRVHLWGEGTAAVLRAERFDLVVDLHGSIRSHLLRARLGVPTIGFRKRNLEKSLLAHGVNLLGTEHLVDRYFYALRHAGVRNDGEGLDYFVTTDEAAAAAAQLGDFAADFIAIVLGATHFTKRMPPTLVAEAIGHIGRPIVLLGGDDVTELAAEVIAGVAAAQPILNLCGRLSLRHSIAVLAKAAGVIAGDTGLMHVSGALRKPMVVVWGNTAPAIGMYPYFPATMTDRYRNAEVGGLACRPCSRIGYAQCPQGHFSCMHAQNGAGIAHQIAEVTSAVGVGSQTLDAPRGT